MHISDVRGFLDERDLLALILGSEIILIGLVLLVWPYGYLKILKRTAVRIGLPESLYTAFNIRIMGFGAIFLGIVMIFLFLNR